MYIENRIHKKGRQVTAPKKNATWCLIRIFINNFMHGMESSFFIHKIL